MNVHANVDVNVNADVKINAGSDAGAGADAEENLMFVFSLRLCERDRYR